MKPHKTIKKHSFKMGKMGKMVLQKAWTRAASTAKLGRIPLETIMKTAGWSSTSVFARVYRKPVDSTTEKENSASCSS